MIGVYKFQCCATDAFRGDILRMDNKMRKRIDKAIVEVLLENPYKSKRVVSQEHKGKRTHRVGDYRIIFAICEECRKFGFATLVGCKDCKKHGSNHIILFSVSRRNIAYRDF